MDRMTRTSARLRRWRSRSVLAVARRSRAAATPPARPARPTRRGHARARTTAPAASTRCFFGRHYRDLWTTPIRVQRARPRSASPAGSGPTQRGGGKQTHSLRFAGRRRPRVPVPLARQGSVAAAARAAPPHGRAADLPGSDQRRAIPPAPLVVSPILDAAGVLHSEPRLVLLPDDPGAGRVPRRVRRPARHASRSGADRRGPRLRRRHQDREHRRAVRAAGEAPGRARGRAGLPDRPAGGPASGRLGPPPGSVALGPARRWPTACPGPRSRATATRPSPGSTACCWVSPGSVGAAAGRVLADVSQHGRAHLERARARPPAPDAASSGRSGIPSRRRSRAGSPTR